MIGYRIKRSRAEDLIKANHSYLNNLQELNHEFISGLAHAITVSIQKEADDLLEIMMDKYKGKLIENLLEICFLESIEEIRTELETSEDDFCEKPEATFLYIIEGKDSQKIKIGITKSVDSRLANLQTANPEELEVINQMEFDFRSEALKAEAVLHEYLTDFRIKPKGKSTEWFKPNARRYVKGLTKELLPQIEEILEKRQQKTVEEMNKVHFDY